MLDEELIKRILLEKPRIKKYIKRDIKLVEIDKIFTIIGPRRAGKTYFLFQIMDELKRKGIKEEQILYINFEDERLADIEKEDFQKIIDVFYSLFPENKDKTVYFMLDEIQNVPGWPKFIRRLYDKDNCKIYLTGSSAKLLSKEIATELRGRTWNYVVFPFSFKEFLKAKGIEIDKRSLYSSKRYEIIKLFDEYLFSGGFPEVYDLDKNQRCVVLQSYYETVMFRDLIERYNLTNIVVVKDLFKLLINNFSRLFSINKTYNIIKSQNRAVSKDYFYSLIDYLEDTFYFFFVPIFSNSHKKKMVNPKKSYIIDNGLINCLLVKTTAELGWFYENLVAIELIRRDYEISYYKNKYECDFIAYNKISKDLLAIQVTLEPDNEREIKGLLESMEELSIKEGIIINKDLNKVEIIDGKKIKFIPLWKWLLN